MRSICFIVLSFMVLSPLVAQEEMHAFGDGWKGRWAVETGQTIQVGLNEVPGIGYFSSEGESGLHLNLSGGYFLSDDFVLRVGLGYQGGEALVDAFTMGIGAKYYLKRFFLDAEFGHSVVTEDLLFNFDDFSSGDLRLGYAFSLADNILFEPSVGIIQLFGNDASTAFSVGTSFFLILGK